MRFRRWPRCEYTVTDRKRAATRRWQQRQRDAHPLLAPLIAEAQPAIEDVMTERVARWIVIEQRTRDQRAAWWRQGRRALDALDPSIQEPLLSYWNRHRWLPGDPMYLLDMLHMFKTGRLVLMDGLVKSASITISAHDALPDAGRSKPVATGWLSPGSKRSSTTLPRAELPHPSHQLPSHTDQHP